MIHICSLYNYNKKLIALIQITVLVGIIIVKELIRVNMHEIIKYFIHSKLLRYNNFYYMSNNNTFNVCINNCDHTMLRSLLR